MEPGVNLYPMITSDKMYYVNFGAGQNSRQHPLLIIIFPQIFFSCIQLYLTGHLSDNPVTIDG